jgi:hypothetical protein
MLKRHLNYIKVYNVQLVRSGTFTIDTSDVNSFNRLLNDFTSILAVNGQT